MNNSNILLQFVFAINSCRLKMNIRNTGSITRQSEKKRTWYDKMLKKAEDLMDIRISLFGIRLSSTNNNSTESLRPGARFEDGDDLKQLKLLRIMSTPVYIMACYVTTLEMSNVCSNEKRSYNCSCISDTFKEDFHYCPGNKKFTISHFCRQHIECNDPIYVCFDIAQKCSGLANRVPEFSEECKEISERASKFSIELLE